MASKHYNRGTHRQNDELRIVMVGKTGIGKSATGNTILWRECFFSKLSATSMTDECSKATNTVDGQRVSVIDTPGLFDTRYEQDKTKRDISQCISYSSPGPHVFLIIVRLGRFTEEEKLTVQKIQEMFGQAADRYSMVLFTHGDLLDDTTIEEFMEESPDLKELMARCNGLYHVFNNKLKDRTQVTELLQKIGELVKKNGGSHYTNEMFQEAERTIEEEKQRILKEKEEEIRKEKKELQIKLQAEYEKKLRLIMEEIQAELENERKESEAKQKRGKDFKELHAEMNYLKTETEEVHVTSHVMKMMRNRERLEMQRKREEEIKRENEWRKRKEEIQIGRGGRERWMSEGQEETKRERGGRERWMSEGQEETKREREEREVECKMTEEETKREEEEREVETKMTEETKREKEERELERKMTEETEKEREEREAAWRKREEEIKGERDNLYIQGRQLQLKKDLEIKLNEQIREVDEKHQEQAREQAEKKNPVRRMLDKICSFFRSK